jgi:hypothetical protein
MNDSDHLPDYVDQDVDYQWTLTQSGDRTRVIFDFKGTAHDCLLPVMQVLRRNSVARRKPAGQAVTDVR